MEDAQQTLQAESIVVTLYEPIPAPSCGLGQHWLAWLPSLCMPLDADPCYVDHLGSAIGSHFKDEITVVLARLSMYPIKATSPETSL